MGSAKRGTDGKHRIRVSGIEMEWHPEKGRCTFENLPVAMMWVDSTLAGLMSGMQSMVGTERFALALQSEGRKSVETDWQVISRFPDFIDGFKAISTIAAVAGWGYWELVSCDQEKRECRFRVTDGWEGRYQKALGVCWGSGMLAGKLAGYCSKLFGTNCWAEQTAFIAKGDRREEFAVRPSPRSIEKEIENLFASDEATRADMAVALRNLEKEVSERRRAEETLRASELFLKETQKIARLGGWKANPHTDYLEWTDGVYDIIEAPRDYRPGLAEGFTFFLPEYIPALRERVVNCLTTGELFSMECEVTTKTGKRLWTEVRGLAPVVEGERAYVLGTFQDITESRRADRALKESEEKYRLLVENAGDAIFIAQAGVLKFANPTTEKLTGYSAQELSEMPFIDLLHPEDRDRVAENYLKRLRGEPLPPTYSFRAVTKAGKERQVQLSAVLITWEGQPASLNFVRDVTEQKKLEEQFQAAQKLEALGTLAGGIAHDFNNLLMGVLGRTSLMLVDIDSSHPHFEHLKGIEEYVRSAADLTRQLLGFARGGKYEVKPTDLNEIVGKSAALFGRTKKELRIHEKYQENAWTAEVDQGQLQQVLMNFFVNAWQAMPGGGDLYLETENVMVNEDAARPFGVAPGRYVRISVTDTGVGMDEETKKRLFEPFFTTKGRGRGTGLGLASAYGIVKNHGGMIDVYSEKGKGSVFSIYLPASTKEPIPTRKPEEKLLKGSETILLVDDEEPVVAVTREMLETLGYRVLTAATGKEAIDVFRANRQTIDLVVLDMIMPDLSGGKTFDAIREANPAAKVLLASGYALDGEASSILERGCSGFIQKPYSLRSVSHKIREILEKK